MTSPFDKVGFNVGMGQQFQTNPVTSAQQKTATPKTSSQPPVFEAPQDEFQKEQTTDLDALKAEIKEELMQEMQAQAEEKQKAEAKANKKGPVQKVKSFIGSFKKLNSTVAEYVKGGFKGIASGALVGSAAYGALTLAKKPGAAKVLGVVGAVGALGVNLWKASLRANEKRSVIDHTWETTPISRK